MGFPKEDIFVTEQYMNTMQIKIKTKMKCYFPHPTILEKCLLLEFPVWRRVGGNEPSWTDWSEALHNHTITFSPPSCERAGPHGGIPPCHLAPMNLSQSLHFGVFGQALVSERSLATRTQQGVRKLTLLEARCWLALVCWDSMNSILWRLLTIVSHLFPNKTKARRFHLSLQTAEVHGQEVHYPSALSLDLTLAALENSIT